jgi:WD40 repeat protein
LALSPEGDLFASGSEDGAVKIWDLGGFQVDEVLMPSENQHAILSKFLNSRVQVVYVIPIIVYFDINHVDLIQSNHRLG